MKCTRIDGVVRRFLQSDLQKLYSTSNIKPRMSVVVRVQDGDCIKYITCDYYYPTNAVAAFRKQCALMDQCESILSVELKKIILC